MQSYIDGDVIRTRSDIVDMVILWKKHKEGITVESEVKTVLRKRSKDDYKKKKAKDLANYGRFYYRAVTANARAKRVGATGKVTNADMEYIYERDGGCCVTCGSSENTVFDHIKSYFNGGTNSRDNLQLLCRICNMKKGVN